MGSNIILKRKEAIYFNAISEIIEGIRNSNLSLTTITEVKLSNDYSYLVIFVTFKNNVKKSMEVLENSSAFIRKKLASIKNQRKVPIIKFKEDKSMINGLIIEKILKSIKK